MERAVELVARLVSRPGSIDGLDVDVQRLDGRTPLIVVEVPATDPALADAPSCSTATSTSSRR